MKKRNIRSKIANASTQPNAGSIGCSSCVESLLFLSVLFENIVIAAHGCAAKLPLSQGWRIGSGYENSHSLHPEHLEITAFEARTTTDAPRIWRPLTHFRYIPSAFFHSILRTRSLNGKTNPGDTDNSSTPISKNLSVNSKSAASSPQIPT